MIENERKYVLKPDSEPVLEITHAAYLNNIQQGYLPGDARIRRDNHGIYFTYKLFTEGVLVEIETKITHRDFDLLWPCTSRRLTKRRYTHAVISEFSDCDVKWDIDYFTNDAGHVYFAMAECEMPENMDEPPSIPDFLKPLIIYAVPRDRSSEFSSMLVSDTVYATELLKTIS